MRVFVIHRCAKYHPRPTPCYGCPMLKSLFRRKSSKPELIDPDIASDDAFMRILSVCRPYTMTSIGRMYGLYLAARYVAHRGIDGDIVECGVWRGGSTMVAAMALAEAGDTGRTMHLFDTFEGMSEPSAEDVEYTGIPASTHLDRVRKEKATDVYWAESSDEEVRANLGKTGVSNDRFKLIKGKVEQTIPGAAPEKIALLRLDTDWYESTRHELEHLYPRLEPGGVLIIDDYGHWQGARQAVDEYFADHPELLLNRLDYTGRVAIKA